MVFVGRRQKGKGRHPLVWRTDGMGAGAGSSHYYQPAPPKEKPATLGFIPSAPPVFGGANGESDCL